VVTKAQAREAARAKAAAEREAAARRRRRTRGIVIASSVVGALVLAGGVVAIVESSLAGSAAAAASAKQAVATADRTAFTSAAAGRATASPWSLPTDTETRVKSAGLTMLTTEGTALHIHQHLSITVDGKAVTVPALLGIDETAQELSALHTHDTSGILHVESPVQRTFHLDQAFAEWDVRLAKGEIGPYVNGQDGVRLTVFVNRKAYAGDPRDIVLRSHEDIDFVITTDGSAPKAPAAFSWPAGY
jgi:hypothetical protein